MRADQLLVERCIAASRSQAQRLIASGVEWRARESWRRIAKNGEELQSDVELRVLDDAELRYASRGGLKLEGALRHTGLDVRNGVCLDVGQSTGGFTDCLLRHGAARVVGIDVGHGQLHERLRADARVVCIEGLNARAATRERLAPHVPPGGFGRVVGDLSFLSLTHVLPAVRDLTSADGHILLLVKPQFELDAAALDKHGIVRDASRLAEVEQRIRAACAACGLAVRDYFASAIDGGDGNREFFVHAVRAD